MRENRKKLLQLKGISPPKSMLIAEFLTSDNKTLPHSTLIPGSKQENLEKLTRFLNLLDFQLLSQKVLSRIVGNV